MSKRTLTPAIPSDRCLCGCGRKAEPRGASVFQLSARCADERFPGANVQAYNALRARFGYDRESYAAR